MARRQFDVGETRMSKRRIEPPSGLPERPNNVTCKRRKSELLQEFVKRVDYALKSFRSGYETVEFNASLARLKRTVKLGRQGPGRGERLHPLIELVVNHHAHRFATERTGDETSTMIQKDVEKAAALAATLISPMRGRPRAQLLDHHVAGMMALIQRFSGTPVLESRHSGTGHYAPRLMGAGRILLLFRKVDPTITETQLVNKVREVRRRYAGKPMPFPDFYPFYGATRGDDGTPVLAPPYRLERFEASVPIYCP